MGTRKPKNQQREEALEGARQYLQARKQFHRCVKRCTPLLDGNDNFIGRISEMLVFRHLLNEGHNVSRPHSKSNKGFDLLISKDGAEQTRVSVKCITWESKSKRSSKVILPDCIEFNDSRMNQPLRGLCIILVILKANLNYTIHDVTKGQWQSRKSRYIRTKDVEGYNPLFSGTLEP